MNSFIQTLEKYFCAELYVSQSGILYNKRVNEWPFINTLPLTGQVKGSKAF